MKLAIYVLALLTASLALADQHERQFAGMNLAQANALQMQLCSLKPRKSMADYDRVINGYIKWSEENDVEVYVLRLTPMFGGPEPGSNVQFDFIEMLISSYDRTGAGWDKWMTTDSGRKLNEQWAAAADCRVAINPMFNQFLDEDALASDTRVLTIDWCTANEGVTADQLIARHDEMAAGRTDDSPVVAWNIFLPGLGIRNAPGNFAHLLSFADTQGLMAYQNAIANEDGWRQRQAYYRDFATCTGENVYQGRVLNRP